MKTPVERLIESVEKGYNSNPVLWDEWKSTMLDAEKEMTRLAFLCGDSAEFHFSIPEIKDLNEFLEYYRLCK